MNKYDEDIIKTLSILVVLDRQLDVLKKKHGFLEIKKDFLDEQNMSIWDFLNSLKKLSDMKYLIHFSFYDKDLAKRIKKDYAETEEEKKQYINELVLKKLEENKDKIIKELFPKIIKDIDLKEFKIDRKEFLKFFKDFENDFDPEIISYILIFPDKNIELLLDKMSDGKSFRDIHKLSLGITPTGEKLILDELRIAIKQKKLYGEVLRHVFENGMEEEYELDNITFFEQDKKPTNKKIYDSCDAFNKRIEKLSFGKTKKFFILDMELIKINPEILPK